MPIPYTSTLKSLYGKTIYGYFILSTDANNSSAARERANVEHKLFVPLELFNLDILLFILVRCDAEQPRQEMRLDLNLSVNRRQGAR